MAHVVTSEIERSTAESVFVERDVAKYVFRLCRPGKHAAFAQSLVLAVVYLQAVEIIVASQEFLVHHAAEVEVHAPIGVGGHIACVVSQQETDTGTEVLIAFVRATPWVGARINYSGLQFKDGTLAVQEYHHLHADLLWNVLGGSYSRQEQVRWHLAPFAGIGLLHHATNGHNPFAVSYGIQGQYRISKRVSALVELSGATTFQDFDGYGKENRFGDHMLSLTAGFSFHIGRVGWKRAIDPSPYIRRDQWLVERVNALSEENRLYAGQHDRDRRALAELKKILEIEGLLDKYSHLFDDDDAFDGNRYPKNNYSGLNSLQARLKNRKWDGKSPLDGKGTQSADTIPLCAGQDTLCMQYLARMQNGKECIGSPVYFFFQLNTARLTDTSQTLNLDELARVAKKYGLSVSVIGAADSMTGTASVNNVLSASRADYIAEELIKRGVSGDKITKTHQGGISDYAPNEANRHTKVVLHLK